MTAVIDPRMPRSAKVRLTAFCEVTELPPFSALDSRVASHPDMLMFRLGEKLFVSREYYNEAKDVIDGIVANSGLALKLTNDKTGKSYPADVKFNAFLLRDHMVGNTEHISEEIKKYANTRGITQVNVKQGYTKCSTVVLKNAVISADKGICTAAERLGADALLVSPDGVALEGYGCGFIGGASGVCESKVFFCGDILRHPDGERIIEFCASHGYEVVSLSDEPLYDVGTILFT